MTKHDLFNAWLSETNIYQAGKTFEDLAREFGIDPKDVLRLAGNESTMGTSPKAIKAAQEASSSSNFYTEPKSEILLSALEKNFAKDIDLTDLAFVCGNGMDSIIEHALTLFTKPGDSIINLTPTFIYYDFACQRQGLEIIEVKRQEKETAFELDIDEVTAAIKDNTKIIFLCTPNNPDGSVTSFADIKKLAQVCEEKGIVLFVDHAYIQFTDRKQYDAREIIKDYPSMIIGYTFSKAYAMAGFRVGYALMHKDLQQRFLTLLTPFLIAKPSIAAAIAALEDEKHLEKILNNNKEQRLWLKTELEALGFQTFNTEANFVLCRSKDQELFDKLLAKGIIIRNMKKINALRITVGTKEENQRLIKTIKELVN